MDESDTLAGFSYLRNEQRGVTLANTLTFYDTGDCVGVIIGDTLDASSQRDIHFAHPAWITGIRVVIATLCETAGVDPPASHEP